MSVKLTKSEQSSLTRTALLNAAQELFTERGYAETATEEIVKRAGVTRGALYYQFRDKADLFRAVFEELDRALMQQIIEAMQTAQGDLWEQLVHTGYRAFLDGCLDPAVQRIVLIDGPAVLSWDTWRRLDEETGLGLIRHALQTVMDEGFIAEQPLEPLVHLLFGALTEAALYIARAEDVHLAREEMGASLERLLAGLRIDN